MTSQTDSTLTNPATNASIARLHDLTTLFHAFVYFADEAADEYRTIGLEGRSGYFASRSAAMGPIPTEMVIATFYNFCPALVTRAMDGVWATADARDVQAARWRGVERVLDAVVRPVLPPEAVDEALAIAQQSVDGLSWSGRPLAAGNHAVLADLDAAGHGDDSLMRLWQLITIQREWRGDTHIGLLVEEPLDGAECTVISEAVTGNRGVIRRSRSWDDDDWDQALRRLNERGWIGTDGSITDQGRSSRRRIEDRTNELSFPIWRGIDDAAVNRFGDLLEPATVALIGANYFAAIGRPAPQAG